MVDCRLACVGGGGFDFDFFNPLFFLLTELASLGPNWAASVSQWGASSPCGDGQGFWRALPHLDCRSEGASAGEKAGGTRITNIHFTSSADGPSTLAPAVDALCGLDAAKEFDASPAAGVDTARGTPFPGAIRDCFPKLHKIKLNYYGLTGPLPAWLKAAYIKLNDNKLEGGIPPEWAESAFWVDVSNNKLTGRVPRFADTTGVFLAAGNALEGDVLGLAGSALQLVSVKGNAGLCGPVPASVRFAKGYDATGTHLGQPCNGTAAAA